MKSNHAGWVAPVSAHSYAHVSASATDGAYSCSPSPYGGASDHAGMGASASTSAALGPSTSAAEAYAFGNAYAHAPQPSAYDDPYNRSVAPSTAAVSVSHSSMYSLLPMDVAMSAYEQQQERDTGAQPAHEWAWPPDPAPSANRAATNSTATATLPRSRHPPAAPAPETVQERDRGGRPGAILAPNHFPAVPVDGAAGAGVGAYDGPMDVRPAWTNLRGGGAVASGHGSGTGRGSGGLGGNSTRTT
ncbi:hypothetical protein JB92DRAFT_1780892 [Gautieria morchelliformis]|nr:hypothetical protein JB92DRAFT_1780892 [Gautieria morchelliformis]